MRAQIEDTADGHNDNLWDAVSDEADAEVDDEAGPVQEAAAIERAREELTYTVIPVANYSSATCILHDDVEHIIRPGYTRWTSRGGKTPDSNRATLEDIESQSAIRKCFDS